MEKEDQIIVELKAIQQEAKVIRMLLLALVLLATVFILANSFGG